MRFIKDLQVRNDFNYIQTERKSLFDERYPGGIRICEWLKINDEYSLSVQASESHYCTPRAYLPLDQYKSFELAIIYKDSLSKDIVEIKDFPKFDEILEYYNGSVFECVPKELVEELYCWWLDKN